nr:hypothetical protein [Micromonospora sp. KC207]
MGQQPYPPVEPYDRGMLDVGDGHLVYWEVSGNPDGMPAVAVHDSRGQLVGRHPPPVRPGPVPARPVRPAWLRAQHAARQRPGRRSAAQHPPITCWST